MTLVERIMDGVRDLSERQQVEIMNHVFRLNARMQQERAEMLQRTSGAWIDDAEPASAHAGEGDHPVESNGC